MFLSISNHHHMLLTWLSLEQMFSFSWFFGYRVSHFMIMLLLYTNPAYKRATCTDGKLFRYKYRESSHNLPVLTEREMETKSTSPCSGSSSLQFCTFLLIISLLLLSKVQESSAAAIATTRTSRTAYINFLKTACNSTTYPKLCYVSLSPYASTIKTNDLKLCNTALNITLKVARNTYKLFKTMSRQKALSKTEVGVIKDCQEEVGDSIDELKQALKALKILNANDKNVEFQIADIKTWVSAALTDENTCTDGFDGLKIGSALKKQISKIISNFASFTSNALALINKLDQWYVLHILLLFFRLFFPPLILFSSFCFPFVP